MKHSVFLKHQLFLSLSLFFLLSVITIMCYSIVIYGPTVRNVEMLIVSR